MTIPVIIALIAAGFILKILIKQKRVFSFIGILANDILLSFFVFASIAGKDLAYLAGLQKVFIYVAAVALICLVSSYLYGCQFLKEDRGWRGALMALAVFPNTAALGFPMVALFTDDLTPAVLYSAASSLLAIPLASFLTISYSRDQGSPKEALIGTLSFPPVTVSLVSLTLVLGGVRLPEKFLSLAESVGWWCLPLMLVYFGSVLEVKKIEPRKILEAGFFRMVLPFSLVLLTLRANTEAAFYAILIESSMPPAIMAASLLSRHKLKSEEATGVTLALTLTAIMLIFILKISGTALAGR